MTMWHGGGIDPGFNGLGVRSQVGCEGRERRRSAGCNLESRRHGVCEKRGRLDRYRNLTKKNCGLFVPSQQMAKEHVGGSVV